MELKAVAKIGEALIVGGGVAVVMESHPRTILACTCIFAWGIILNAMGAMVTTPLQKEIKNLKAKIAGLDITVEASAARKAPGSTPAG